jgi:hypothetical protein
MSATEENPEVQNLQQRHEVTQSLSALAILMHVSEDGGISP